MPDSLLKWLLANPDAGYAAYLLITGAILVWAIAKDKLVTGNRFREVSTRCTTTEATLREVQEKLVEQRVLNERSTSKIEAQAQDILERDLEIARLKGVLGRLEGRER
jgi:hypothetical protein